MNKITEFFFGVGREVFSWPEVCVAIPGSDHSRYGLLKRAISKGEILKIRRGLYCMGSKYRKKPISIYSISQYIYGPSYISMEMALSYHGWIPEGVYSCTCASYKKTQEYCTSVGEFIYKRIPQKTFYAGVERCVDENRNVYFMGRPAKALSDYIYAHRLNWDIWETCSSLRIDVEEIEEVPDEELSILEDNYKNKRVRNFLKSWRKSLL